MIAQIRNRYFYDYSPVSLILWMLLVGLGGASVAYALAMMQWQVVNPVVLLAVVTLLVAANLLPVKAPDGKLAIATGDFVVFLLLLTYGTHAAVIAAAIGSLTAVAASSKRITSYIFSPLVSAFSMFVAANFAHTLYIEVGIHLGPAYLPISIIFIALIFSFLECFLSALLAYSKKNRLVSFSEILDVWGWAIPIQLIFAVMAALTYNAFSIVNALIVAAVIFVTSQIVRVNFIRQEREKLKHQQEVEKAEAEIRTLAFHDQLTGLGNRALFNVEIEKTHRRLREQGISFAIIYLDVDRFKVVNDGLGHHSGDQTLKLVATMIKKVIRDNDIAFRVGGDEFCVILNECEHDAAINIAQRISESISIPIVVNDTQMTITASVGVRVVSDASTPVERLLVEADNAMYVAKRNGKAQIRVFVPGSISEHAARIDLEYKMKRAVVDDTLIPVLQPIINIRSGKIHAFEMLIRSSFHANTADLISIAEESTLINDIAFWTFRKAVDFIKRIDGDYSIHVNISPRNVESIDFCKDLVNYARNASVSPSRIVVEITESSVMFDRDTVYSELKYLSDFGFKIAIDDFGIGYSSLSYLSELPFDEIKIDASFTQSAPNNSNSAEVIRLITALSKTLGKDTVAEGVETEEQAQFLESTGVYLMQGFRYSQPLPFEEAEKLLRGHS